MSEILTHAVVATLFTLGYAFIVSGVVRHVHTNWDDIKDQMRSPGFPVWWMLIVYAVFDLGLFGFERWLDVADAILTAVGS